MNSELLYSSYRRYKEDTNTFTTWLSKAAQACGFKLAGKKSEKVHSPEPSSDPIPVAPRLKGKARKEAKAQALASANNQSGLNEERKPVQVSKYEMTTSNLIEQAEAVANSGKVNMSVNVLRIARRAINARKRCTNWFKKTESKDEASTQAHAHFTATLEQALNILKPCYNNQSFSSDHQPITQKPAQSFDDDLTNRFRMLQVEDKDNDVDITAPEIIVEPKGNSKKSRAKGPSEQEVWELEEEFYIEIAFVAFCFFEDLHRIQDFLKKTWQEYKHERLDLMTCTMTTNLAFDLVRSAEEEVINQAPELGGLRSYQAIATLIFYADSLQNHKNLTKEQEAEDSLKITPFDEFIYLSTARLLIKFEQFSAAKIAFPQPVPSVRMSYISRPDLLELPQVRKWEEEDEFLSKLLMDMSLEDEISRAMLELTKKRKQPASDELSKGLYNLRKEGEVSTWIVFAARVLLDIREIMGEDFSRGYREQVAAGCAAFKTLDMRVENGALTPPAGELWRSKDTQHVLDLWTMLQSWTMDDPFLMTKQEWLADEADEGHVTDQFRPLSEFSLEIQEMVKAHYKIKEIETEVPPRLDHNVQHIGLRHIEHATDLNFQRMQNPLASGTTMFNILLDMEHAGTALANHYQAIFATAHLYNAARQTQTLEVPWPDMDELIQAQIVELFSGKLPQEPKRFYSRAALRLGLSAQHFARNKRRVHPTTMKGSEIHNTQTSKILQDYISGKEQMARCVCRLQGLIHDAERESNKIDKRLARRQLSSVEALIQVREWLSKSIPVMSLDYIKLTRVCNKLLETIHTRAQNELGVKHRLVDDEESRRYGYVAMTLYILNEVSQVRNVQKGVSKSRDSDPVDEGRHLDVCAQVLREYLAESSSSSAGESQ